MMANSKVMAHFGKCGSCRRGRSTRFCEREEATFDEYREPLHGPGTIVVTATDGVWETVAPDGEFYGKDRLRDLIRKHRDRTASEIMEAVIEDTNRFRGHDRAADDLTMVLFKIT